MLKEKYGFKEIEDKYNILWEGSKVYKWNGEKDNTFTIDTPPPTISGKLHIGHIFSYCHTDFIARFQRMLGKDVFYPIGFDDNGLPTERLVEQTYKTRAKEVGREKFIEMCHEVIEKSKQEFKELFKSVGISYDWSLEYHTISKETVTLSQMSFIDLYNKGYAYRKMQPILWDPIDKTAIAQAEIEDKVFESSLNTIVFLSEPKPSLIEWDQIVHSIRHPTQEVTVSIVGKYTECPDAYKSLVEALNHGAISNKVKVKINWVNSREKEEKPINEKLIGEKLQNSHAILVPGGFGDDGVEGKILAINYARTNNIPFFGICLGMQLAIIEFARNVVKLEDAHSEEFHNCKHPIVKLAGDQDDDLGGTMRLGAYKCNINASSKMMDAYSNTTISERHRHRYIINSDYKDDLEKNGLLCSGISEDGTCIEAVELESHPWFIGVQFHPEFQSKPFSPHPLFVSFIKAAVNKI